MEYCYVHDEDWDVKDNLMYSKGMYINERLWKLCILSTSTCV